MKLPDDPGAPTSNQVKDMAKALLFVALYPGGNSRIKATTLWNQMDHETQGAFMRRALMALDIIKKQEERRESQIRAGSGRELPAAASQGQGSESTIQADEATAEQGEA